jgi:hypothetical protein
VWYYQKDASEEENLQNQELKNKFMALWNKASIELLMSRFAALK